MFLAVAYPGFHQTVEDLRRFVLTKEDVGVPPRYRFHVCYHRTVDVRLVPVILGLRTRTLETVAFSEITFPPFGYFLTLGGARPPHDALTDITFFGDTSYHREREIHLAIPLLAPGSDLPADYRTAGQIAAGEEDPDGIAARLMNPDFVHAGRITKRR
jgi:hypothetical protein